VVPLHTSSPSQSVFRCSEIWRNPSSGMLFRLVVAGRQMLTRVSIIRAFTWETLAVYRKWPEHQLHSAIMTRLVRVFLAKKVRMTISDHPIYLPDLTPCDLWHFQNWRLLWKARDFQTLSEFRDLPWPSWWAFQKGFLETFYTVETPTNHVRPHARRPLLRQ
jgi:hypothetical protein